MRTASVAAALARSWTVAYTAGLPRGTRDQRREEIASDLWEQRHQTEVGPSTVSVVARVVLGMSADLLWRSGELRRARRLELMNLKVDAEWDLRMRLIAHAAIIALIALYSPIVIGLPRLLAVTLPAGSILAALEIRRLQRERKEVGIVIDTDIAGQRRRRAIALAASVAIFAIGLFVNALPSENLHDEYWFLFVAPSMVAFLVGVIALLMLGWSYIPRRESGVVN